MPIRPQPSLPTLAFFTLTLLTLAASVATAAEEPTVKELTAQIRAATRTGKIDEALKLCDQAIKLEPANASLYGMRAQIFDYQKKYDAAIADFTKAIEIKPAAELYQRRGETHFRACKFKESVADFDKVVAADPDREPHHWQRGISHYYAEEYRKGVRQFELHKEVNAEDVENAIWHFLCKTKADGIDKARKALIPIRGDGRPWAMTVYNLFREQAKPAEVLENAVKGEINDNVRNDNLFYSHLYLALYYDAIGSSSGALEHITIAVEKYQSAHYMGDVARVHLKVLQKKAEDAKKK